MTSCRGSCNDPITKKSKRIKPPWNPWELFMPPLNSHYKSYWNPNSNLWRGTVHGTLEQQPLLWIHRACLAARVWFLFQPLRHWSEKAGSIWYFFIFFQHFNKEKVRRGWTQDELMLVNPKLLDFTKVGISASKNGGTVLYKAIFCGDIPLHRPYIYLYIYI